MLTFCNAKVPKLAQKYKKANAHKKHFCFFLLLFVFFAFFYSRFLRFNFCSPPPPVMDLFCALPGPSSWAPLPLLGCLWPGCCSSTGCCSSCGAAAPSEQRGASTTPPRGPMQTSPWVLLRPGVPCGYLRRCVARHVGAVCWWW